MKMRLTLLGLSQLGPPALGDAPPNGVHAKPKTGGSLQ